MRLFKWFRKKNKIHGHELIQRHEDVISKFISGNEEVSNVLEIGSQRIAGSTLYLSKLCNSLGAKFYTVDLNVETTKAAELIVHSVNKNFESINDYGEKFLEKVDKIFDVVYLDAFDIEGEWHSDDLKSWYQQSGNDLTNENCWKMHLECAYSCVEKVRKGGFVVFDDVNPVDKNGMLVLHKVDRNYSLWSGKGTTAIPYLLENGFEIFDNQRSGAVLRKL